MTNSTLSLERLTTLENFGHSLQAQSHLYQPVNTEELAELFRQAKKSGQTVTLRGAGRSYNDAEIGRAHV